jgi:8-oxo-dGTP diphosphatase
LSYQYCPQCSHPLEDRPMDGRVRKMCGQCGFIHYQNPAPAAAVILPQSGEVLLVKRKYAPREGQWSLPAGFVEYDEDSQQAAVREAKEETGLEISIQRLFNVYGACDDPRSHVVLVVYVGQITGGALVAGDDAIDATFFPLNALPEEIAFSSHRKALMKFADEVENH